MELHFFAVSFIVVAHFYHGLWLCFMFNSVIVGSVIYSDQNLKEFCRILQNKGAQLNYIVCCSLCVSDGKNKRQGIVLCSHIYKVIVHFFFRGIKVRCTFLYFRRDLKHFMDKVHYYLRQQTRNGQPIQTPVDKTTLSGKVFLQGDQYHPNLSAEIQLLKK